MEREQFCHENDKRSLHGCGLGAHFLPRSCMVSLFNYHGLVLWLSLFSFFEVLKPWSLRASYGERKKPLNTKSEISNATSRLISAFTLKIIIYKKKKPFEKLLLIFFFGKTLHGSNQKNTFKKFTMILKII